MSTSIFCVSQTPLLHEGRNPVKLGRRSRIGLDDRLSFSSPGRVLISGGDQAVAADARQLKVRARLHQMLVFEGSFVRELWTTYIDSGPELYGFRNRHCELR